MGTKINVLAYTDPAASYEIPAVKATGSNKGFISEALLRKIVLALTADTQIIVNDNGLPYGESALTFDKTTGGLNAKVKSTGGVAIRTLANRFADTTNVKDHGALGDGSTDDSAAILLAAALGKPLFYPPGVYLVKNLTITEASGCRGMLGAGATIKPASGSTSATILFTIQADDFFVDQLFFDLPISTTAGSPPACDRSLYFSMSSGSGARWRIENCRFRGGTYAAVMNNADTAIINDNVVDQPYTWGFVLNNTPVHCIITNNRIKDVGENEGIRIGSSTQTTIAEKILISNNVISGCGWLHASAANYQDGLDLFCGAARSLLVTNNIIRNCAHGGMELKTTQGSVSVDNIYQQIKISNNLICCTNDGIGIAVNWSGTNTAPDKAGNILISDNFIYFDLSGTATAAIGINVTAYTDLAIVGNGIAKAYYGIKLDSSGSSDTTTRRPIIVGNVINVEREAISATARTVESPRIAGNVLKSISARAIQFDSATITDAEIVHNDIESTGSDGIELRAMSDSYVGFNSIKGALAGILSQGAACTNVKIEYNRIKTSGGSAGEACNLSTGGGWIVQNNSFEIPDAKKGINGAGTYTAWNNNRGMKSAAPTTAGALGDVWGNSAITAIGSVAWHCTTAGSSGVAVWKATAAVGGMASVAVSASDTVTAVASNNALVAFAQTYAVPANTLKSGTVMRVRLMVQVTDASGADTLTVELRLGGTSLTATTAVDPGAAGDHHILEFAITSRAAPSAASSLTGSGIWYSNTGGTMATKTAILAPTNFATSGALTLDVRAKWSSNTANTTARLETLNVELIG
jgi:hypothetical protein